MGLTAGVTGRHTIGLTGGIGSGKSTVAQLLVQHGAALVDTDAIARSLTAPGGAAIDSLRKQFGPRAIAADGALDRDHMRSLVFADAGAKRQLESILHPMIGAEATRQSRAANRPVVVFDVPLLVESGRWRRLVDRVLVVDCSESCQVERVMQRSGWQADAVHAVMAQQATRPQRRAAADAVLHNDGLSLPQLATEVAALWRLWAAA